MVVLYGCAKAVHVDTRSHRNTACMQKYGCTVPTSVSSTCVWARLAPSIFWGGRSPFRANGTIEGCKGIFFNSHQQLVMQCCHGIIPVVVLRPMLLLRGLQTPSTRTDIMSETLCSSSGLFVCLFVCTAALRAVSSRLRPGFFLFKVLLFRLQ